ncbi:MAG: creatininase family protein [Tannerellaceae bacterium]|nr:creatininase family protein [Tannerellaceae bacterium]
MEFQPDSLVCTYGEVKEIVYDYAVLPWGATEPHNYHLPYLTDCYTSYYVSLDAVRKAYELQVIRGMVLPPIPLGMQNPGQHTLSFCLHARYETQKAILTDIVASLQRQNIHTLFIINGHGGNCFKPMIRDLALDFPEMTITVSDWYAILPAGDFFEEKGDHADELETSVMLHYRPDLVHMGSAGEGKSFSFTSSMLQEKVAWLPRHWGKVSSDTGIGDPRKASAEKGHLFVGMVTDKLARLFVEVGQGQIYP